MEGIIMPVDVTYNEDGDVLSHTVDEVHYQIISGNIIKEHVFQNIIRALLQRNKYEQSLQRIIRNDRTGRKNMVLQGNPGKKMG